MSALATDAIVPHAFVVSIVTFYCWHCLTHTHTHTRPFNGPLSGTTRVSRYQRGKTNLDFTEARDSEWQWHQLGYMQLCTSPQTDNHASTPPLSFFTGWMPFLPPNQQCQSTEGNCWHCLNASKFCFVAVHYGTSQTVEVISQIGLLII